MFCRDAITTNETWETGLLSLIGLDIATWSRYGLVVYLAVSNQSINHKRPVKGVLDKLNLGSLADPDFQLPSTLSQSQMQLLAHYAGVLRSLNLDWSNLVPSDWYPRTSEGARAFRHIQNMDVDEKADNGVRGSTNPPLAWLALPLTLRLPHLSKLWDLWIPYMQSGAFDYSATDHFRRALLGAVHWREMQFDFRNCVFTMQRFHTVAKLLTSIGLSIDTLDNWRTRVWDNKTPLTHRPGFTCSKYMI
jgi:hypothetical protein